VKDPNAPTKPLGAFFTFLGENRAGISKDFPHLKGKQVGTKGGEMWKELVRLSVP
jgi:hypothetical protein